MAGIIAMRLGGGRLLKSRLPALDCVCVALLTFTLNGLHDVNLAHAHTRGLSCLLTHGLAP